MAQMTDQASTDPVACFYDRLSRDYDRMTGFEKRFVSEKPFFRILLDRYGFRTAIDAGAGTGFHSLLLSQLGVRVTAIDVSKEMLAGVRRHAAQMGLNVDTLESSFQSLPDHLAELKDAVFCLGNSLAHLLDVHDLELSIRNFARVLEPGGLLFVQILNYERILERRERVMNVKEEGDALFVRFYEYEDRLIRFNVLKLTRNPGGWTSTIETIKLLPWMRGDVLSAVAGAGFAEPRVYGGISMEPFDPGVSKDLVILAVKGS
jgi:SAM-dependent methyltransferase